MATQINNDQPSLALTEFVTLTGVFPSRSSDNGLPMGTVRLFAGNFAPGGDAMALGQLLPIAQNTALFALFGTTYGGNGTTTFALPNLDSRVIVGDGAGPGLATVIEGQSFGADLISLTQANMPAGTGGASAPVDDHQPSLGLKYGIRVEGVFASPLVTGSLITIGTLVQFANTFMPAGYMAAEGQLIAIADNTALFSIIGTTYGGDGQTTFALPDLRGRAIIGTGQGPGLTNYTIGQTVGQAEVALGNAQLPANMGGGGAPIDNHQPSLALSYIIALQGIFPPRGSGTADSETQYLGEVMAFAGDFAPKGWALAQGQLLSIAQNTALFALLGTQYGGDGQTTFALPDLRGRAIVEAGGAVSVGDRYGVETFQVNSSDVPALNYLGGAGDDLLFGGDADDTIGGAGGADRLNGGLGADTLSGNAGNDYFVVESSGDRVLEAVAGGADDRAYVSAATWALEAGQEVERVIGASASGQSLTGNEFRNFLYGGAGNDILDGGGNADAMSGGAGNDTYAVDTSNDRVYEAVGGGVDTVNVAAAAWTAVAGQEIEFILGALATGQNLTGNNLANALRGGAGSDRLDGGAGGGDVLTGLGGDDYYFIDNATDQIVEAGGGGSDDRAYISAANWAAAAGQQVERLIGVLASGLSITGNDGDEFIYGAAGADALRGGKGSDALIGNVGDDAFAFNAADFVAGQNDQVYGFNDSAGDNDKLRLEGVAADYAFSDVAGSAIVQHLASGATIQLFGFGQARLADQIEYF